MIAKNNFGRTAHRSSRVIFGAAALSGMRQERADELLVTLEEFGVNHIDVAADYGEAELRLAPWLASRRGQFFLATKTQARDGDGARASLERSLDRLGVDSVDLIQLHNLVEEDEWATAHAPGGAVSALARARDEGLARFIGVTGHGLRIASMHLRSLERFDFAPCSCPTTSSSCRTRRIGETSRHCWSSAPSETLACRPSSRSLVAGGRTATHAATAGMSPSPPGPALDRAVRFVLANDQLFLNTSSDATLLRPILEAAADAGNRGAPEVSDLQRDVEALAMRPLFDGAALEKI